MDVELSETENNHIYHNYPRIFTLKKCIIEFEKYSKPKIWHYYTYLYINIEIRIFQK